MRSRVYASRWLRCFVALAAGRSQEAVDAAEPAKSWDTIYPGSYVQGLAYLQMHDAGHALSAFQDATKSPAGSLFAGVPFFAQAQLGLARAYAMGGDKDNAKKAYEAFLPPGKMQMSSCPRWWWRKKNTLRYRQERMAGH
jgi:tetratricopeptide (TPR) repeat protein